VIAGGLACTLLELSPVEFAKTTGVKFLDWTIQVPNGIAYLGAATGRSIVPAVLARETALRFRLRFGGPLPPPARDRASIYQSRQQLYHALEEHVLRFPEQWIGWPLLPSHMGIELQPTASAGAPPIS
jgi:lauroyl/myristoyl acyltransferase